MDPGKCEQCGETAVVHTCEIRNGEKFEHHRCQKHARTAQFPGFDVDRQIREAIEMCQIMLPTHKRNPENVAAEFRRLVERALSDMNEDARAFGFGG
jgi:hypothetical protein